MPQSLIAFILREMMFEDSNLRCAQGALSTSGPDLEDKNARIWPDVLMGWFFGALGGNEYILNGVER